MRIVAGTARGRRLRTPPGDTVRPTTDRVREAVFNSLESHGLVRGRTVVDLFAGSGALGLEALSRGAAHVTFVERDRRTLDVVAANVEALGFADRATLRLGDGPSWAATAGAVDLALLDPPYAFDAWPALLASIDAAAVVVESDRIVVLGPRWQMLKEKRYAATVVVLATRAPDAVAPEADPADPATQEGCRP